MAQQVKGPALSLLWLRLLLWLGFDPWPRNFCMLQAGQKKKKKKKSEVPIVVQWKQIRVGTMRLWVQFPGLTQQVKDPVLL